MALRAFRSNPSIGGFGGESVPIPYLPAEYNDDEPISNKSSDMLAQDPKRSSLLDKLSNVKDNLQLAVDEDIIKNGGIGSDDDAFAQIVKELVDNAVDACTHAMKKKCHICIPKRVKVVLDPINHQEQFSDVKENLHLNHLKKQELIRVTVFDNGVGMKNINDCVTAFSTSKSKDDKSINQTSTKETKIDKKKTLVKNKTKQKNQQVLTAGRYGIGLTLCLLHAQRLVPNSFASITSATAKSTHWTRSRYVVDAQRDVVLCVKEEKLPKNQSNESGTAVSLLVPGGTPAKRAWPRLAEYLSRFYLSGDLCCSLQVMAPTLSLQPLYIIPPKQIEKIIDQSSQSVKTEYNKVDTPGEESKICSNDNRNHIGCVQNEGDAKNNVKITTSIDQTCDEYIYGDWNDGMDDSIHIKNPEKYDIHALNPLPQTTRDQHFSETMQNNQIEHNQKSANIQTNDESKAELKMSNDSKVKLNKYDEDLYKKKQILRAVQRYLNRTIELENVAYSSQRIWKNPKKSQKNNFMSNCSPMLEVNLIVCGNNENNDDSIYDIASDVENSSDDYIQNNNPLITSSDFNPSVAKLILVRMVNNIPLLDGAEAHACGLVRGLSSRNSLWNNFGLEMSCIDSPNAERQYETKDNKNVGKKINYDSSISTLDIHIPTFAVKDSVQVLPYFQSSTHALFEKENTVETNGKENASWNEFPRNLDESEVSKRTGENETKRNIYRLLPAGLRLGNILVVVHIHAESSALPLPTLSKGRLPLNNRFINEALDSCVTACLKSLQKSNPKLLLTTQQLKRTERDLQYVPAVAAAMASIICNSTNELFRKDALQSKHISCESIYNGKHESNGSSYKNEILNLNSLPGEEYNPNNYILSKPTKQFINKVNIIGPYIEELIREVLGHFENHSKLSIDKAKEEQMRKEFTRLQEEAKSVYDQNPQTDEKRIGNEESAADIIRPIVFTNIEILESQTSDCQRRKKKKKSNSNKAGGISIQVPKVNDLEWPHEDDSHLSLDDLCQENCGMNNEKDNRNRLFHLLDAEKRNHDSTHSPLNSFKDDFVSVASLNSLPSSVAKTTQHPNYLNIRNETKDNGFDSLSGNFDGSFIISPKCDDESNTSKTSNNGKISNENSKSDDTTFYEEIDF